MTSEISTHSSLASGPVHVIATSPQNSILEEEDEEQDEDDDEEARCSKTQPRPDQLPWHHEQLYKLYGKEADYFLYPKFDDKEKKKTAKKPMNPKLRKYQPGKA